MNIPRWFTIREEEHDSVTKWGIGTNDSDETRDYLHVKTRNSKYVEPGRTKKFGPVLSRSPGSTYLHNLTFRMTLNLASSRFNEIQFFHDRAHPLYLVFGHDNEKFLIFDPETESTRKTAVISKNFPFDPNAANFNVILFPCSSELNPKLLRLHKNSVTRRYDRNGSFRWEIGIHRADFWIQFFFMLCTNDQKVKSSEMRKSRFPFVPSKSPSL